MRAILSNKFLPKNGLKFLTCCLSCTGLNAARVCLCIALLIRNRASHTKVKCGFLLLVKVKQAIYLFTLAQNALAVC